MLIYAIYFVDAFLIVLGVLTLQIGLSSNRARRELPIILGVVTLLSCLATSAIFSYSAGANAKSFVKLMCTAATQPKF